jgi:hypothetical protein
MTTERKSFLIHPPPKQVKTDFILLQGECNTFIQAQNRVFWFLGHVTALVIIRK